MDAEQQMVAAAEKPKVLAQVRHARILETLARKGAVSVSDVASQLAVSEMTVRRDLIELEKDGRLVRTHGGAVRSGKAFEPIANEAVDREEPTFESRLTRNAAAKRTIAMAAAGVAAGARTLALDVGTTTYLLSGLLLNQPHTKIFTNGVRNAMQLGTGFGEVYLPGGRMRGEEMAISSQSAVSQFEELWFDIAFVGVSGITAQGIYDYSFEDTDMKRVYLRRATQKVVLCDSTKFKRMSLVHIAPLQQFDMLITDAMPPADLADALAAAGVDVRIAPEEQPLL
ncbi:DeoR/GlpR family DNA-binding transcription regulator [Rhizobium johnstonii]|jgi:DeoR family glycerol-3-phosphate regulon repressor|uniref:DeoR family transcriptional regulator n=5 Tax=Rhizobium TaxID=379 RepID=A0A154I9X7_RHILE|nr:MULTISPECIES: DeoR/GlpR family DNA-binding transcription regulator [Rhizobium]API57040.1 DeoR family transcriptional regulator [Rhizobium leguminosarum]KZA97265.1 DeoR family transcriptional regulator [Rhizobium leguminosarum]MBB3165475.1 DeoR family glycerol-3-phosphate regulon repressor [Rhizobium laguerreae]MBB4509373.1 DeoR family glycerol-3-phosphate regulon repressor [Rhizobium leguminosarum]MBY3039174.1 DeoR/GlpR transcriptional regulator [Rhizobium laguerreae]